MHEAPPTLPAAVQVVLLGVHRFGIKCALPEKDSYGSREHCVLCMHVDVQARLWEGLLPKKGVEAGEPV